MVRQLIFVFILFGLSFPVQAGPPSDEAVNQWVLLALNASVEALSQRDGVHFCTHDITGTGAEPTAWGKSKDLAHGRLVALCIKRRCGQIQGEVNSRIDQMRTSDPDSVRELLESLGTPPDQVEALMQVLAGGSYGPQKSNCEMSQLARILAYDSCALKLHACGKE
ncbi:MAG: hypothetical protein H6624_16380 [Bdellovibrionaceae bacterium]|nr:hypothetical protein [Bdellovibrionales bacterium]MCB9085924.1 hypothetical protein [Pseudobdellovibrionaceae bacterium]